MKVGTLQLMAVVCSRLLPVKGELSLKRLLRVQPLELRNVCIVIVKYAIEIKMKLKIDS